jgi:hypothetical protein
LRIAIDRVLATLAIGGLVALTWLARELGCVIIYLLQRLSRRL